MLSKEGLRLFYAVIDYVCCKVGRGAEGRYFSNISRLSKWGNEFSCYANKTWCWDAWSLQIELLLLLCLFMSRESELRSSLTRSTSLLSSNWGFLYVPVLEVSFTWGLFLSAVRLWTDWRISARKEMLLGSWIVEPLLSTFELLLKL